MSAVILGVLAIALSFWITATPSKNIDKDNTEQPEEMTFPEQERLRTIALDSDDDGLKDWEELLAGTDPRKPDTDGDGVLDLDAVNNTRAEKASNLDSDSNIDLSDDNDAEDEDLTLTEDTVQKIFSAYIRAKLTDTYDRDSFVQVVGSVTDDAFNSTVNDPAYTIDDIKTTIEPTEANVIDYRNTLDKAMDPVIQIDEYELSTYARAVEQESKEEYAKLINASNAYKAVSVNLLIVPTPTDITSKHLELINIFTSFADTLENMGTSADDPIGSYVYMRDFLEKEEQIDDIFDSLRIYFTIKHGLNLE